VNTDNLDKLTDAELSGLFAKKVARLKNISVKAIANPRIEHYTYSAAPTKDNPHLRLPVPSFATSADAVLPWLNKHGGWCHVYAPFSVSRGVHYIVLLLNDGKSLNVTAPTFARAACLALIRAKRATGGKA